VGKREIRPKETSQKGVNVRGRVRIRGQGERQSICKGPKEDSAVRGQEPAKKDTKGRQEALKVPEEVVLTRRGRRKAMNCGGGSVPTGWCGAHRTQCNLLKKIFCLSTGKKIRRSNRVVNRDRPGPVCSGQEGSEQKKLREKKVPEGKTRADANAPYGGIKKYC